MNSPEEKAKEITYMVIQLMYGRQVELFQSKVKEVTTFCVDEIISTLDPTKDWDYWQKVKEEIIKL